MMTIVYIYPLDGKEGAIEHAGRFVETYQQHPPGIEHNTLIVCNGSHVSHEAEILFSSLPGLNFLVHDNSGYDIGGFQKAAREFTSDLMLFFGASSYFRIPDWGIRVVDSFNRHGDNLYGATANCGNYPAGGVHPHIRTTGFWMRPALLNEYPVMVTHPGQRYPFEHGPECLTTFVMRRGSRGIVVTRAGEFERANWDHTGQGYHQGNQSDLLFGDRLTAPPYFPIP